MGWIALALTVAAIGWGVWRVDDWSRDWTRNTASLHPDAENPELRPLEIPRSVQEAGRLVQTWAENQSRWQSVSSSSQESGIENVHLTRRTPVFGFVDDIEIEIRAQNDGAVVHATSRSRVGKGDLGQNPRNLIELVRGLKALAKGDSI